jgi:hypothetical protein
MTTSFRLCVLGLAIAAAVSTTVALPQPAGAQPAAASAATSAASSIQIGFNGADITGTDAQPPHVAQFYAAEQAAGTSDVPRCHAYVSWDIGLEPAGSGASTDPGVQPVQGSLAWLQTWLQAYQGTCDQALITFKWIAGVSCHYYTGCAGGTDAQAAPDPSEVGASLAGFLHDSWPGWSGTFAFTPWNEPNNSGAVADGFTNGLVVPARSDADYYLAMRSHCDPSADCEIAAGDFNSNGNHYQDFVQQCADDTTTLCPSGSYVDTLKYYLANDATSYGLPAGFRPENFAFHGWADANDYLHHLQNPSATTNCDAVSDPLCVTRLSYDAFSTALYPANSSWSGVQLWDTEVGVGQNGNTFDTSPTNDQQAQTAAFLLDITSTVSDRITRIYYTRAWEPDGAWWSMFCSDGSAKPSLAVWANRQTSYTTTGSTCPS